jgi:hypothetical protein
MVLLALDFSINGGEDVHLVILECSRILIRMKRLIKVAQTQGKFYSFKVSNIKMKNNKGTDNQ